MKTLKRMSAKMLKGERGWLIRTVSSSRSRVELQGTLGGKVNTSKGELVQ